MTTFCTLFDSRYLSRGVAMYESLSRHLPGVELVVFPFDDACRHTLESMRLPGVRVIPLEQFEDAELLAARANRPWVEYLWTCTPSVVLYVLEKLGRNACTYVDADLLFFASPEALLAEAADDSILLTEHRYTPSYDQTAASGRFNVQFMLFRRDERGLRALRWWRERCLESCELNVAEGKCGDQKYLDDWKERFDGVHTLEHLGGGVAPWNVQQYEFAAGPDGIWGTERRSGGRFPLVFYHFHALHILRGGRVQLTSYGYELGKDAVTLLYRPYVKALQSAKRRILQAGADFDPHGPRDESRSLLRARLGALKRRVLHALATGSFERRNFNSLYDMDKFGR